jgi:hypothetical protein
VPRVWAVRGYLVQQVCGHSLGQGKLGPRWKAEWVWTPTYHDNMVPGEALGQLGDVAPVRGLLARDQDIRGTNLHCACVCGHGWGGDFRLQELHPL